MSTQQRTFPSMPLIGQAEGYYARLIHEADRVGDTHLHESGKVGQYITLALDPALAWEAKLKYFQHAIKNHCQPPSFPGEEVWDFYRKLAGLARQYCGQEALRIASQEDDLYAVRQSMGQTRELIENDAEVFFDKLLGHHETCPEWFDETDWEQLKMIRDQWI